MKIAEISVYAEGYWSGASYVEVRYADYETIKHLNGKEMYFSDLDGKHSEVEGTIEVHQLEDDFFENNVEPISDGDQLLDLLQEENVEVLTPTFSLKKRNIVCNEEQWKEIQKILCL